MPFGEMVARVVGMLLALILVLVLAWLLLRWMNGRVGGGGSGGIAGTPQRMIRVLDRVSVGRNSSILLLRVEDRVILVAVSDHAIEKLMDIEDPEGRLGPKDVAQAISFTDALKDAAGKLVNRGKDKGGDGDAQ